MLGVLGSGPTSSHQQSSSLKSSHKHHAVGGTTMPSSSNSAAAVAGVSSSGGGSNAPGTGANPVTSGLLASTSGSSGGGTLPTPDPVTTGSESDTANKDDAQSEWHPPYPRLCAYHDCHSLAAAWGLGPPTTSLEAARPTGASQAQSPSEDDPGDNKSNDILASCPAFRNELGTEPVRRLALSRLTLGPTKASCLDEELETWQREHTAAEAGILEDVSNVYLGGRLCAVRQPKIVIEPQDIGSYYFRHCFAGRAHIDYFGTDEQLGPIAVSLVKESSDRKEGVRIISHTLYRLIIRISDLLTMRVAVPEEALPEQTQERSNRTLMRELLELVCPQIHFGALRPALSTPKVEELLLKIDEQPIYTRYKVGILYCRNNQSTEEQMYNNETSSPAFEEFLDFLGQRVRLKGFDSYKGGLDTRGDTTGEFSIYTEYHSHEVMFHVSTMLPFTPNNRQQLSRKRHIGNDMVTIIFQEPGALPFSPITVRSHFQHVFIIVRVSNPCTDNVSYRVAVSRVKDVPAFGPPIQTGATYTKCAEFHDFLLTKIINAENAVHRSKKFAAMAARTRREALKDLAENYVTAHQNEGPSRIASRFLGGSVKRKERPIPKPVLGANVRGALSWSVDVHDHSLNRRVSCVLGVSAEAVVLLEMPSGAVLFATPTPSIIGWANTDMGLKLYYDHGEMLLMRCVTSDGTARELNSLLRRLEAVTNGEEAKELILRRTRPGDTLGFHIQEEGVVTDVEMYQTAWKTGLRQGSRIVEMENMAVSTMSLDQMTALIEERPQIRIMMIAPSSDGNPRRGCEDPNCPAVKGQEVQILTPDTFAKQPLTYQEMFKIRNKEMSTSAHNSPSSSFEERLFNFSSGGYKTPTLGAAQSRDFAYKKERSTSIFDSGSEASTPGGCRDRRKASDSLTLSFSSSPPTIGRRPMPPLPPPPMPFHSRSSTTNLYHSVLPSPPVRPGVVPPIPPRTYKKTASLSFFSNSMHDHLSEATNVKYLDRAQSDEVIGFPTVTQGLESESQQHEEITASDRHLSFDNEVSKWQWKLQKMANEKKALELLLDQFKTQLAMEKRAHEATKKQLLMLQHATRDYSNPPELDDHL